MTKKLSRNNKKRTADSMCRISEGMFLIAVSIIMSGLPMCTDPNAYLYILAGGTVGFIGSRLRNEAMKLYGQLERARKAC